MNNPTPRPDALARFQCALTDASDINERLLEAARTMNLVTPAPFCGQIPDGFEVMLSTILLSPNTKVGDVYQTDNGGLALHAVSLNRIARAAGVSLSAVRTDNRREPRYASFTATARWKQFDNTPVSQDGSTELDLRDGSDLVRIIREKARSAQKSSDGQARIDNMRRFLVGLCETMAMSRAIRKMGLKSSYAAWELERPFVVASLHLTGRSKDPAIQRAMTLMIVQSALDDRQRLYGPRVPEEPPQESAASAPPGVGGTRPREEDLSPPPAARGVSPALAADAPVSASSGFFMPRGARCGAIPVETAKTADLTYWSNRIANSVRKGESRDPVADKALAQAMGKELVHRANGAASAGPGPKKANAQADFIGLGDDAMDDIPH